VASFNAYFSGIDMTVWTQITQEPSTLGECPFWHAAEQALYWVDIAGFKINRLHPASGSVDSWAMPSEPGCMAPAKSGGLVIALRDRVVRARAWGGELATLASFAHDPKTTRANDGKCDAKGRFWIGTMYEPRDQRIAELLLLDAKTGSLTRKASDATVANGLAWASDAKTMYWANTPDHAIQAWDFDASSTGMAHHRIFKSFPAKPAGWTSGLPGNGGYMGRPDGAAVDSAGNYWVAMFEGKRVLQLSPSGNILRDIETPVTCPTMVCFGGDELKTLYLTSARHNRSFDELAREPGLGCVFSLRVDVAGLPVNEFVD
jgi:sugar lactone lactonase YvrE